MKEVSAGYPRRYNANSHITTSNRYFCKADYIEKAGGCGAYRLKSKEIEQAEIMKKRWGSLIKYDFNRSMNPTVRIPIKGI